MRIKIELNKIILYVFLITASINMLFAESEDNPNETALIEQSLDSLLIGTFSKAQPGIIVLVSKKGKPIYTRAIGVADISTGELLSPEHKMEIGSISKQITALAAFVLINKGLMKLEDPVTKFFPRYKKYENVTIHHLMTHSSGIKDYFKIDGWRNDLSKDLKPQQVLRIIYDQNLEFIPGEKTEYSNSGYHILGMILEKVSKQKLNNFIRDEILIPCQMTNTCFISDKIEDTTFAKGYEVINGFIDDPFQVSPTRFFAGGEIITTVSDLLKWDNMLYNVDIIPDSLLTIYFSPYVLNDGNNSNYACGWELLKYKGKNIFAHGGGTNGFVAQVFRLPDEKYYIVVLSNVVNHDGDVSVQSTAQDIINVVTQGYNSILIEEYAVDQSTLQKYAGDYILPDFSIRTLEIQNGKLYYVQNQHIKKELTPISKSEFAGGQGSKLIFHFNDIGEVKEFEIHTGRGMPIKAKKI